jgi:hypothetical protein
MEEPVVAPEVVADPVETAKQQEADWHEITEHVEITFRGKRQSFNEVVIYVRKVCNIGPNPELIDVRHKEEDLGNLIADIYIQKAKAQYAYGKLEGQRMARLGRFVEVKDRRSTTLVEARMAAHDEPYQAIMALVSDCKSTLDFWHDMYNICMRTADRLKQISMAHMAEMKLEPSDSGGRGEKVRGTA